MIGSIEDSAIVDSSSEESAPAQVEKHNEDNQLVVHDTIDNNVQSNARVVQENKEDGSRDRTWQ